MHCWNWGLIQAPSVGSSTEGHSQKHGQELNLGQSRKRKGHGAESSTWSAAENDNEDGKVPEMDTRECLGNMHEGGRVPDMDSGQCLGDMMHIGNDWMLEMEQELGLEMHTEKCPRDGAG